MNAPLHSLTLRLAATRAALALCCLASGRAAAADSPAASATPPSYTLTEDGAWCWFSDPRALLLDGQLYAGWMSSDGSVQVGQWDPARPESPAHSATLAPQFEKDDHDHPALLVLPDQRLAAFYAPHAWGDVHLEPDGDLPVAGWGRREDDLTEELYVTRLSWRGEVRWRRDLPAHHDVRRTTDGRLVTLTMGLRDVPAVDPDDRLKDNRVTFLDEDGRVTGEHSLYDALARSDGVELRPVRARRPGVRQVDLLHANAVQVTSRLDVPTPDALRAGQLLVTLRNQDVVDECRPHASQRSPRGREPRSKNPPLWPGMMISHSGDCASGSSCVITGVP